MGRVPGRVLSPTEDLGEINGALRDLFENCIHIQGRPSGGAWRVELTRSREGRDDVVTLSAGDGALIVKALRVRAMTPEATR